MTVDLPDQALSRLRAEAVRRGVRIDEVIAELADQLPADDEHASRDPRRLAFLGAGASESGITPRLDELLADGFGRE